MVVVVMKIRIVFLSSYKCDWWQELRYSPVADVLWRNRLKLLLESLHFINNNQMDKNNNSQGCNQEFFTTGEVSWNEVTLINISFTTHQRKEPQEKILEFFLLLNLKTVFQMRNLTNRWTKSGHFSTKSGHFFSIFNKGHGRLPPFPLVSHLITPIIYNVRNQCIGVKPQEYYS